MDKLPLRTHDLTERNFAAFASLFPNAVTESIDENGEVVRAIDADILRQEINTHVVSGKEERYQFTWPDKKKAVLLANAPIAATLRPCREESVDFDNTENLFIEGDNLDVLKLLRETYLNRVKMIYIDPPYNTGNDFIYEDDFADDASDFLARDYQYDEDGNRMVRNLDSNGRFHTDWLNMIYPRLKLAKYLLSDDGVVFISIGDAELHNLKKICDEIFGSDNYIVTFSRMMKSGGAKGKFYTPNIDYLLAYANRISETKYFRTPLTKEQIERFYNKEEQDGPRRGELYGEERLYKASLEHRANQRYYIKCPDGSFVIPPGVNFPQNIAEGEKVTPTSEDGVWKWTYDRYKEELKAGNIIFKETNTSALLEQNKQISKYNIYNKLWLIEQQEKGAVPSNYIQKYENRQSASELKALSIPFDFAKPVNLINYLLGIAGVKSQDIVLDFFSGSATTAHAVMQLNVEDGVKRKFIMVQLPEKCDEDSEAAKAGYKNICEIGRERIRRAGAKIKADNADKEGIENLDIGFRVLKLDSSNMKDVYYTPQDMVSPSGTFQIPIDGILDNIKPDRSAEDLLFQVMLDLGIVLSSKIEHRTIGGKAVFFVADNYLIACFDRATDEIVTEIAKSKPYYAVFRDSSFANDATLVNFEQIFKTYSPTTIRKVL